MMGDFFKDSEGHWWFKTIGKGNKARQIAVSNAMLEALQHYRQKYLNLSPLPSLDEKTPLIPHLKNSNKFLTNARHAMLHPVLFQRLSAAQQHLLGGDDAAPNF